MPARTKKKAAAKKPQKAKRAIAAKTAKKKMAAIGKKAAGEAMKPGRVRAPRGGDHGKGWAS